MIRLWAKHFNLPDCEVNIEFSTFPGGEEHVRINNSGAYVPTDVISIEAHITSSSELMRLVLLNDSIDRYIKPIKKVLYIPYVPYARQDRVCASGEALSIKVVADIINSMRFEKVIVVDPHSLVTPALIDNVFVITADDIVCEIVSKFPVSLLDGATDQKLMLVSTDAGSYNRVARLSESTGMPHLAMSKTRNKNTGAVSMKIVSDVPKAKQALIVDDICDGGRTFIEASKLLLERSVLYGTSLYVTHGIFSNGLGPLFYAGINRIYTTDSFCCGTDVPVGYAKENNFHVYKIDWGKYV